MTYAGAAGAGRAALAVALVAISTCVSVTEVGSAAGREPAPVVSCERVREMPAAPVTAARALESQSQGGCGEEHDLSFERFPFHVAAAAANLVERAGAG